MWLSNQNIFTVAHLYNCLLPQAVRYTAELYHNCIVVCKMHDVLSFRLSNANFDLSLHYCSYHKWNWLKMAEASHLVG